VALFATTPTTAAADIGRPTADDSRRPDGIMNHGVARHAGQVLFVNFDGGTLTLGGTDNAPANETIWSSETGSYPAYGDGPDRSATLAVIRSAYGAYNMQVTDERPASGNYTMIMVGPTGGGGGFATLDCGNFNPNNIGFVDNYEGDQWGPGSHGALISHEAGHTFGLEHIDNYDHIMAPTVYEGATFASECVPLTGGVDCSSQHSDHCGSGQNAHQELLGLFGSNVPDMAPPEVFIASPADGTEVGPDFQIVAEATDDVGVDSVTLWIDGENINTKGSGPWQWPVVQVPQGAHELQVIALDAAGNETASDVVDVVVVPGGANTSSSGSGGSDSGGSDSGQTSGSSSTTGDGGSGGTDGSADTGVYTTSTGLPPGFGSAEPETGCACRADSHDSGPRRAR
jgi:hypothetical protein